MAPATMTEKMEELYRHEPPLVDPIPVGDLPFLMDDNILKYEEIAWAVRRIFLNR